MERTGIYETKIGDMAVQTLYARSVAQYPRVYLVTSFPAHFGGLLKKHNGHISPKRIGAKRVTNKSGLRVWLWKGAEYPTAADVWNAAYKQKGVLK